MTRPERDVHLEALMAQVSALMKEQNVSQAELARRMNINRASVCNVLKLKVDPRASTLVAMLKALNRTLDMRPQDHVAN
jgi:predicted XRE-type DNA-binding protein